MKRFVIITMVFFTAALAVNGQSAKKYFKAGEDFAKVNKFEDAISQYSKAIELDPKYEAAYISRATAHERLNDFKSAAEDYERALVFVGKDEEIQFNAGRAYLKSGQAASALVKLNKALEIKSTYLDAYQYRIQAFIELERFDDALNDCKRALKFKQDEMNYYYLGLVYEKLELFDDAEAAYKNSILKNGNVLDSHLALAKLSFEREKFDLAMQSVNQVLRINSNHKEGLMIRSRIHARQMNLTKAVDDISLALTKFMGDPELLMLRGDVYQQLSRHTDAIIDYTMAIDNSEEVDADAYYKRARSYEAIKNLEMAMKDYDKLLELSEFDGNAQRLLAQAKQRMFELNRERDKPVVKLVEPTANKEKVINIPKGTNVIALTGLIDEKSDISILKVNDFTVQPTKLENGYEFLASINLRDTDEIKVEVTDVYENSETSVFKVLWTERDIPKVNIVAPYASDNNMIYLDAENPVIYVEGQITDESLINSIYIDGIAASYRPTDLNPVFSARVDVENRNKFTVVAEDIYGNKATIDFTLNKEAYNFADNPMGKTWVIFIENSDYEYFASLEGPTKDVTLMKTALLKYQVHNYIHKKDMTKQQMERFFSIELRDLIRGNQINSIMIWYAGHGKFINETGYWIPVDAQRDDEFTYFSVNALKAYMQSYPDIVTHTLVVTDACESGPSFYQAMRSTSEIRSCDDWNATRFKSSQVLSSAGYELASDDSQFTRTFANTLLNNPDSCIPIESIVQKVTTAVAGSNQQKPQFGKIAGLQDENGTFFFIPKY